MTVSELKKNHAPIIDGTPLWVSGYHEPGDGGEGFFQWMPGGAREGDGGHWISAPQGGGGWMRAAISAEVNVKHFGARGDGKTDDAPRLSKCNQGLQDWKPSGRPPGGIRIWITDCI